MSLSILNCFPIRRIECESTKLHFALRMKAAKLSISMLYFVFPIKNYIVKLCFFNCLHHVGLWGKIKHISEKYKQVTLEIWSNWNRK